MELLLSLMNGLTCIRYDILIPVSWCAGLLCVNKLYLMSLPHA